MQKRGMADNTMTETEELDLGGDICLHVGAEGSKQLRIRASKTLLQYASDYFKALFGPRFNEGATADAGKDIRLEDDDADAFALLCKILHMRYRSRDPPSWDELVGLGIVADKYGCVESLRLSLDFLFSRKLSDPETGDALSKAIVASYLLDEPSQFTKFTQRLVTDCTSPFTTYATSDHGRLLPCLVWFELEVRRSKLAKDFGNILLELSQNPCCSHYEPCDAATAWSQEVNRELWENGLDVAPLCESLSSIHWRALQMSIPDPVFTRQCGGRVDDPHIEGITDGEFKSKIEVIRKSGLCLDCVRAEGQGKDNCRVAHLK